MPDRGLQTRRVVKEAAALLAPVKEETYRMMHIPKAGTLLDVGCGAAVDTLKLSSLVGKDGVVLGIDADARAIAAAERAAAAAGRSHQVRYIKADARGLPLPDAHVDAVRSARLLQHVADASAVVAEMARVLKPGGWLVLADADHSSTSVDNAHPDIEWRFRRGRTTAYANGCSGRGLYGLIKAQGLVEATVRPFPLLITSLPVWQAAVQWDQTTRSLVHAGLLTWENVHTLSEDLMRRAEAGAFFGYGLYFVASGRKPEDR